ncbi:MAG: hypothetical protein EHM45_03110 [Desulfobacteraceae bacterium]|nr:MAG: hypothetical protein EHM45_03110 [Desulfobacteraceae bacterium]
MKEIKKYFDMIVIIGVLFLFSCGRDSSVPVAENSKTSSQKGNESEEDQDKNQDRIKLLQTTIDTLSANKVKN